MWKHRFIRWPGAAPALALVAALLGSTVTVAEEDPVQKYQRPSARIQVVLKQVHILDDHDWGAGEMSLQVRFGCLPAPSPCLGQPSAELDSYDRQFSASTGETFLLDAMLPHSNERISPVYTASVETGYSLYMGQQYEVTFHLSERDTVSNWDNLGKIRLLLTHENGWGIGPHSLRSDVGDYEIAVDIRPAPLPDLRPTGVKVLDLPAASKRLVCVAIENVGPADAGTFEVAIGIDGPPPTRGNASVGHLASGQRGDLCVETDQLGPGLHSIMANVDPSDQVIELDEASNLIDRAYTTPAKPANVTASPTTTGSVARADLTVSSIRVNGQAPDGKDDCQDGKNIVTVVVKNAGAARAEGVTVRLAADGNDVGEEKVNGLEAGQEQEVRFEDVRLKKGQRTLVARAGFKSTVAEAKEDNGLKVTAACKGGA